MHEMNVANQRNLCQYKHHPLNQCTTHAQTSIILRNNGFKWLLLFVFVYESQLLNPPWPDGKAVPLGQCKVLLWMRTFSWNCYPPHHAFPSWEARESTCVYTNACIITNIMAPYNHFKMWMKFCLWCSSFYMVHSKWHKYWKIRIISLLIFLYDFNLHISIEK